MKKYFLSVGILFSLLVITPLSIWGQKIYYQPPAAGGGGCGITETQANGLYWRLLGNANTTALNFLGTTDAKPLVFKTNNTMAATILPNGYFGINTATPEYRLDINANITGNPLRLQGLVRGDTATDKILTSLNGVVRWIDPSVFRSTQTTTTTQTDIATVYADNDGQAGSLGVLLKKYYLAAETNTMGVKYGTLIRREY